MKRIAFILCLLSLLSFSGCKAAVEHPDASTTPADQKTFTSAPVEPEGCVSDIDEIPYSAAIESTEHKLARQRKDKAQQRCDRILAIMKQESAKCRNVAATTDETDTDQTERSACIREETRLTATSDAIYAELNAAMRHLNAVTESEKGRDRP